MCKGDVGLIMFHWIKGIQVPSPDFNTLVSRCSPRSHDSRLTAFVISTSVEILKLCSPGRWRITLRFNTRLGVRQTRRKQSIHFEVFSCLIDDFRAPCLQPQYLSRSAKSKLMAVRINSFSKAIRSHGHEGNRGQHKRRETRPKQRVNTVNAPRKIYPTISRDGLIPRRPNCVTVEAACDHTIFFYLIKRRTIFCPPPTENH